MTLTKSIQFRKLNNINMPDFINAVALTMDPTVDSSIDELLFKYDSVLKHILDIHAPLIERNVTIKSSAPWYTHAGSSPC